MNCARMLPIELVLNFQRIMAIRSFSTSSIHSAKSQPGYFVPLPEGQTLPDLKDDKRIPGKKLKLRRSGFVKYKKGLAVVSPKANLQTGGRLPALQPEAKSESAQRIFLPNINLYLVRNGPQHANDPFTATFRCPITLTKPDIVQYLRQVYGVQLSGIRTAVYRSTPRQLRIRAYSGRRTMGSQQKTYKKAVVQLKDPFLYPPEPNREFLNEHWSLEQILESRAKELRTRSSNWLISRKQPRTDLDEVEVTPRLGQLRQVVGEKRLAEEKALREKMKQQRESRPA